MLPKKVLSADLEHHRVMFLEIGLAFAILFSFGVLEWNFKEAHNDNAFAQDNIIDVPIEIIQTSQPEEAKPEVAPVAIQSDVLKIVKNDVALDNTISLVNEPTDDPIVATKFPQAPVEEPIIEVDDPPFLVVEQMPMYGKGGLEEFQKFVQSNVKYDENAAANNIFGTVIAEFIVNKDGSVSDIKILRSVDKALDNEVIRVIKKSKEWTPGKQREKPVRVKFTLPIAFKLN